MSVVFLAAYMILWTSSIGVLIINFGSDAQYEYSAKTWSKVLYEYLIYVIFNVLIFVEF